MRFKRAQVAWMRDLFEAAYLTEHTQPGGFCVILNPSQVASFHLRDGNWEAIIEGRLEQR